MARANGLVHQVTKRAISNGAKTIYDVNATLEGAGDGGSNLNVKLSTFDQNLAGAARKREQIDGQAPIRSSFDYKVEQKGQYTNYYLNGLAAEGELAAADDIPDATPSGGAGGGGRRGSWGGGGGRSTEEKKSIVKQNVLRTAADFVAAFYGPVGPDFYEQAEPKLFALAEKLYAIAKEGPATSGPVQAEEPAPVQPTTPAEVADGVPGVQVGTDGIPTTDQTPSAKDAIWN